jgi:hypothetical protein
MSSTNFHYFWPSDNVAPNAVVTSGSAEDSSYPLATVVDISFKNLAKPGGITATSGYFDLAWGAAQDVKAILLWTNFMASLAYRVQSYVTNPASLLIDEPKTAPPKRGNGHTRKIYHDLSVMSGYSATAKHVRINITGTNDANLRIKILALSTIRNPSRNISWGLQLDDHQTKIAMDTEAHQPWEFDLSAPPRLLVMESEVGTDADAELLNDWHGASSAKPTLAVPDPSNPDPFLGLFRGGIEIVSPSVSISTLPRVLEFTDVNRQRVTLKEIVSGDPEWT